MKRHSLILIVMTSILLFNRCGEKQKKILITDEEIEQTYQWLEKNHKYDEWYRSKDFTFKYKHKRFVGEKKNINEMRKILTLITGLNIGWQIDEHIEVHPFVPKIKDEELIRLKPLQNLRSLGMNSSKTIKGSGLVHLKHLRKLEELFLRKTVVDDASLKYLIDIPSLKALYISSPNITSKGIDKLKRARPDLKIEYEILYK